MKNKGKQTEKGKLGESERLLRDVTGEGGERKMSSDSDRGKGGGEESEGLMDGDNIANGLGQCCSGVQLALGTTSLPSPVLCSCN